MARSNDRRNAASRKTRPKPASRVKVTITAPAKAPQAVQSPPPPAQPAAPRARSQVQSTNMCFGCDTSCCDLRVDLTLFDIARIFHMSGKPVEEFADLAPAADNDSFAIRLNGGLYKLVLRHDGGKCHFIHPGNLKCTIEESKPAICLSYPFSLHEGNPYIRDDVVCPFENLMRADRTKMSKQVLEAMFYEAKRYEETLNHWNSCTKGGEELGPFLKFASNDLDADRSPIGGLKKRAGRFLLRIGLR